MPSTETTTTTVTAEPTTTAEEAESPLDQIHQEDLPKVDLSTTQWVAQLDSKSVGMVVDGPDHYGG